MDEALLNRTEYAQPAIFVVAYALATLWMSLGVRPAAVMGHSIGEYVAATIAGALPLETALAIIATRGRMMQALPPGGIMVAVRATETQAAVAIQELQEPEPSVSIAAVNTANQVVIAGRRDSVEAVVQRLNAKPSPLLTSHAFHSPLMQGVIEGFSAAVGSALSQAEIASSDALDADRNCEAPIRFISTVGTARTVDQDKLREAAYWVRHIVSKVDFYGGVQELQRSCHPTVIIEIGPRPVLSRLIQQILPSICSEATERPTVVHSLERGVSAGQALLQSMATLYVNHHIDNQRLQQMLDFQFHDSCLVHDLPFPDYAHKSYWFAATSTAAPGFPSQTPACTSNSPRMQQVELPLAAVPQAPSLNPAISTRATTDSDAEPKEADTAVQTRLRELVALVAEVMGEEVAEQAVTTSLYTLGLDFLLAVELLTRINGSLQMALPVTVFFHYPDLRSLATFLCSVPAASQGATGESCERDASHLETPRAEPQPIRLSPLVTVQPGDAHTKPLFLVPGVAFSANCFFDLAAALGTHQPLYSFEDPSLHGERSPYTSLEEIAGEYVELLLQEHPDAAPYRLGGWSMGGIIAYEMNRQLLERGIKVELLILLDATIPAY